MRYILIIAQDRLPRSFIGAQLKEEGFEVIGSAEIMGAALELRELGIRPDLVIIDTLEQHFSQEGTNLLSKVCAKTPLLLVHGACDYPSRLRWQAKIYQLAKPITVGQVVDTVKQLKPNNDKETSTEALQ